MALPTCAMADCFPMCVTTAVRFASSSPPSLPATQMHDDAAKNHEKGEQRMSLTDDGAVPSRDRAVVPLTIEGGG